MFVSARRATSRRWLLDIWEYARFGTTAGHAALDDADRDERSELLELAFNTDPANPDAAAAPAPTVEAGYRTLTIARRAGVNYSVQSASDPGDASFSAATTTVLLDSATTLKVRDNFPIATTPQRFLRLRVTAAP